MRGRRKGSCQASDDDGPAARAKVARTQATPGSVPTKAGHGQVLRAVLVLGPGQGQAKGRLVGTLGV
ncbi:MAG: hypothetical protein ACRDZX_00075 [Acidimicrobiales bacterium]